MIVVANAVQDLFLRLPADPNQAHGLEARRSPIDSENFEFTHRTVRILLHNAWEGDQPGKRE